jgi:hypothetical protein
MILMGTANDTHVVASVDHYNYISKHGVMADGGQPHTLEYAGYSRHGGGRTIWFEVPQTFADLYADYYCNPVEKRQYGCWELKDVRVLSEDEVSKMDFDVEKRKHSVWGTRGKDGKSPLKFVLLEECDSDHLVNILEHTHASPERRNIIKQILADRGVKYPS